MEQLTTPSVPPVYARQRNAILAVLILLAVAGWVVFLRQATAPSMHEAMDMAGMDMGDMRMAPDLTMGGSWPLFASMWIAMMVAMMFPAAAPMVLMYGRMQKNHPMRTSVFTASYIALWIVFGVIAFLFGAFVESLISRSEWIASNWARAGGILIAMAGIYQLTPLKQMCLRHCRTPMSFVMHYWRNGTAGAVRMGLRHGLYCLGCCWLLFVILVPIGLMNVAAMIAIAAIVFAEKVLPWGRAFGYVAAAGLVVYGVAVVVQPNLLPTVA